MKIRALLLAMTLTLPVLAPADVLLVDGIQQNQVTDRPTRGMSMASVENRYGAPTDRRAAVGEPPITRWEYPGFTVFFEHQYVIHAVVRR